MRLISNEIKYNMSISNTYKRFINNKTNSKLQIIKKDL